MLHHNNQRQKQRPYILRPYQEYNRTDPVPDDSHHVIYISDMSIHLYSLNHDNIYCVLKIDRDIDYNFKFKSFDLNENY